MKIALFHPMLPTKPNALSQFFLPANHGPGIAGRAEVLCRVKAKRPDVAHGAGFHRSALEWVFRAERLRGVLDQLELKALGDFVDRLHFAAEAVEMDRHDGADLFALRSTERTVFLAGTRFGQVILERPGRDVAGGGIDVEEDGRGAETRDTASRGKERIRTGKD